MNIEKGTPLNYSPSNEDKSEGQPDYQKALDHLNKKLNDLDPEKNKEQIDLINTINSLPAEKLKALDLALNMKGLHFGNFRGVENEDTKTLVDELKSADEKEQIKRISSSIAEELSKL